MKLTAYSISMTLLILLSVACEDAVLDVNPPVDSVEDSRLDNETQIPFLIKGIQAKFAQSYGALSVFAGALSDELLFDRSVPGATFPTYAEISSGNITLTNASIENSGMIVLAQLRFLADTLVTRTGRITFSDPALRSNALYHAYFYGAIARYFWGSYFGLEPERGGGVINAGPFIPSSELYSQALDLLDLAVANAPSPYDARVAHSLMARIHLMEGRYAEAGTAALTGLESTDPAPSALYSSDLTNFWHYAAGSGRTQFVVDDRFSLYLQDDPDERSRIPIVKKTATRFRQDKYPANDSPIPFMVWQEMMLIRAEATLRSGQSSTALDLVNTVRQSHGLKDLEEIDLATLMMEREKELFCMGMRLLDQRRTENWHLASGTWRYLPITQRERDSNPNLQ